MVKLKVGATLMFAAALLSAPAQAATIFENTWVPDNGGDCSFSTTCAATAFRGDDYAANQFSVSTATTARAASFAIEDTGTVATAARWAIYADVAGLPGGPALYSGISAIASTVHLGTDFGQLSVDKQSFDITPSLLSGPGVYWLAIQAVSPVFETYLLETAGGPSAETDNGGITWKADYDSSSFYGGGVAFGLYGSQITAPTPLPGTLPLLVSGLSMLGLLACRRRAGA